MHDVDAAVLKLQSWSSVTCGNTAKVVLHTSACHVNCLDIHTDTMRGRMKIDFAEEKLILVVSSTYDNPKFLKVLTN